MKVLSLFSGVGGFDLGLEAAGMETVALCEWDKHAQAVLRRHWPNTPLYGDVSELTGAQLIADGIYPDLVAFGSPCQDLSVAGKRAGLEGERSGLFHQAIRIIRELRTLTDGTLPRWVIWENVVGALNSNGGADFQAVLDEMGNLGADLIEWAVLDAQNYGVPQRRRRVFLVACLDPRTSARCPDPLLPVGEGSPRDLETLRKAWKNTPTGTRGRAAGAIARAHGFGSYSIDDRTGTLKTRGNHADIDYALIDGRRVDDVRVYEEPVQTLQARMGTGGNNVPMMFSKARRAKHIDDFETWEEDRPAPTLNAFDNGDIRTTTLAVQDVVGTLTPGAHPGGLNGQDAYTGQLVAYGFSHTLAANMGTGGNRVPMTVSKAHGISGNVIGRQDHNGPNGISVTEEDGAMFTLTATDRHAVAYGFDEYNGTTDEIHNTLRAGTKQPTGAMVGSIVRRLTPRECERLMGWPDDWTRWRDDGKEQADSHRYKQIGNGVASPVALWVGRQIFAAEHLGR